MAGLDPEDWAQTRALGHRMVDDMIDWLAAAPARPVWQRMPDALRHELAETPLPQKGRDMAAVYEDFRRLILPWGNGNEHPRFMGWVHGGGNPAGALAMLLTGFFNANCGGRDHAGIEIERQVIRWAAEMVGLPAACAGGLLVTGTSMANLIAVLVARRMAVGEAVRGAGVAGRGLVAYASVAAHGCVPRAMEMAGLGTQALRGVAAGGGRIDLAALAIAVAADRAAALHPFLVVGNAGTVDTGAVDDLAGLAAFCAAEGLWFHVDGAFGATAALSPRLRPLLHGIELADSVALDFHKWAQVPYDAGCVLVRRAEHLPESFAQSLAYLETSERGLAGNAPWPRDLGPDLSRGFRALKVWMTLQTYGAAGLGRVVEQCCEVAAHLGERVAREPALELLAPVGLGIVCFRVARGASDLDALNREMVAELAERGLAAVSTTRIDGRLAIRAGIFNHRTQRSDVDALVDAIVSILR